jgi:hypothetical protein
LDGWIAHAWLERDGMVYDAVVDRFMDAQEYTRTHGAVCERRYSLREAAENAASKGNWGPWHATPAALRKDNRS